MERVGQLGEVEIFQVNPSFLKECGPQNYDDFGFSFETNEDGSFKSASFKGQLLEPNIGAGIFLMRGELIKAHRKERDQYKKKIQAVEKREEYKKLLDNQTKKQKEHRKQIDYKDRTVLLYRRILENLVLTENDKNEQKR